MSSFFGKKLVSAKQTRRGYLVAIDESVENDPIAETCRAAAMAGGKCLLEWKDKFSVREKAPKDLVTEADLASQNAIYKLINGRYPNHEFLGEEEFSGNIDVKNLHKSAQCWIVDPLDGTINYVHQLPSYSVSVAYAEYGVVKAGAIYDPVSKECFYAIEGKGAWRNGIRIETGKQDQLAESLVIVSLPTRLERGGIHEQKVVEMIHHARTIRRLGSAALNCCYVAAGMADAYWAESIQAWDIAAGLLIANEAGAHTSDLAGQPIDLQKPKILVSGSQDLSAEIISLFQRVGQQVISDKSV